MAFGILSLRLIKVLVMAMLYKFVMAKYRGAHSLCVYKHVNAMNTF